MAQPIAIILAFVIAAACSVRAGAGAATPSTIAALTPPTDAGPVIVQVRFDLHDVNQIDDEAETFEFTGVMTMTWRDRRQAFDPAVDGVEEKVFQGGFQFDEISPGWYPQVVIANQSGMFEVSGVLLRVRPDGTCVLVQTVNAVAEARFHWRRYPLDRQRLSAVFEILGFGRDEVTLEAAQDALIAPDLKADIPQWAIERVELTAGERPAAYAGRTGVASTITLTVAVRREIFYITRLIIIPLVIIVLLSFSVFWMDRSSLGDRISVSFIGILTGVAYQLVMSQNLPRIAEVTLMHGFLNASFITMCATVVINLVVGGMDKRGRFEAGNRIDRRCRWVFPLVYFGLLALMLVVESFGPAPVA